MQSTAATVNNSQRLGNRLMEALAQLLSQKTVSGILHTCATIGTLPTSSRVTSSHNSKSIWQCNTSSKCFVVLMNISFQMFVLNSCTGMMDIVHLKRRERGRRDDSGVATSLNYGVALSLTRLTQYVLLKWALRELEALKDYLLHSPHFERVWMSWPVVSL
jgi:hypothetical protein